MFASRHLAITLLIVAGLSGCGQKVQTSKSPAELAVLAESSFFKGELTPGADPLLGDAAAKATDGGFIAPPPTTTASDSGSIPAPGTGSTTGSTSPTSPSTPSTPSTSGGTASTTPTAPGTPTAPTAPPSSGVPTSPSSGGTSGTVASGPNSGGDGGVIAPPSTGNGNDGGVVGGPTGPVAGGTSGGTSGGSSGNTSDPNVGTSPTNPVGGSSGGTSNPGTVAQNPSAPSTPGSSSSPSNGGADGGSLPAPGTNPGPADGGLVQNPSNPTGPAAGNGSDPSVGSGGTSGGSPTSGGSNTDPGSPGSVAQNPSNPSTGGGAPTTPGAGDGGALPGTTNPGSPSDGGGIAQNPPGVGGTDSGSGSGTPGVGGGSSPAGDNSSGGNSTPGPVAENPAGGSTSNPSNPSVPSGGGTDVGSIPGTGTTPGPVDGGVVQNPSNPGSDGGVTNPSNPGTGSGSQNPGNPGTGSGSQNPSNPGGGVAQNPGTPTGPGDVGTTPCPDSQKCSAVDITINRVCSVRRSAIAYPQFIFFEEARNPILTLESTVNACTTSGNRQIAGYGSGAPHPMESHLVNLLLNPYKHRRNRNRTPQTIALARKGLMGVDLSQGKFRTRLELALPTIKAAFPRTWHQIYVNAQVCDDSNNDGLCYGEPDVRNLMTQDSGFKLSRIPRELKLMVWNGRSRTLSKNPDECEMQISPLVLDLNGDGFAFTSADDGVLFDLNDDGEPVLSGWTVSGRDDVFVVRDVNRNGTIDTGAELFGSATRLANGSRAANGFAALADLDSNSNGQFDSGDAAWREVGVWLDRNHNGYSERGELYSLERAGVKSISVEYLKAQEVDTYGNETRQRSTYTRQIRGGTVLRQVIDIWFSTLRVD